jgi:hypothetical protein
MRSLRDQIARLEMRAEQILIHLRSLPRDTVEAEKGRSDLLAMLLLLVALKGRRERVEESLGLQHAA